MTFLNIWRAWNEADRSKRWCGAHFLNYRNLLRAADIRRQLEFALRYAAGGFGHCLMAVGIDGDRRLCNVGRRDDLNTTRKNLCGSFDSRQPL